MFTVQKLAPLAIMNEPVSLQPGVSVSEAVPDTSALIAAAVVVRYCLQLPERLYLIGLLLALANAILQTIVIVGALR